VGFLGMEFDALAIDGFYARRAGMGRLRALTDVLNQKPVGEL
jgi:hypothetical protein